MLGVTRIIVKVIFIILVLTMLRPAFGEGDHFSIVGSWVSEATLPDGSHISGVDTIHADGSYAARNTLSGSSDDRVVLIEGTLRIKDGYMIETVTNNINFTKHGNFTNTPSTGVSGTNKIVRLDDHEMVIQYEPQGFQTIFRKQLK